MKQNSSEYPARQSHLSLGSATRSASLDPNATGDTPEQKLLTRVRGFKEARRDPRWSAPLGDAWDEFLVRLVRRMHQSAELRIWKTRIED